MAHSKSLAAYSDVHRVLMTAIEQGGGAYTLPSKGKALRWRQRAYTYRKLLREAEESRKVIPSPTFTPFDGITLLIDSADPRTVVILTESKVEGTFRTLSGDSADVVQSAVEDMFITDEDRIPDDMEEAAAQVRRNLFGGGDE